MHYIQYLIFIVIIYPLSHLPFWWIYRISDVLSFILYLLRFKRKNIEKNVRLCFPNKSEAETNLIIKESYTNLTDGILEIIKSISMSPEEISKRYKIEGLEVLEALYKEKKSAILTMAHYANWEWAAIASGKVIRHNIVDTYMPLPNPYLDELVKDLRTQTGVKLVTAPYLVRYMEEHKTEPCLYTLLFDNSPAKNKVALPAKFLGTNAYFYAGAPRLSIKYDLPILYANVTREKRGFYKASIDVVCEKTREKTAPELMQMMVYELSKTILQAPENWFWAYRQVIPTSNEAMQEAIYEQRIGVNIRHIKNITNKSAL